MAERATRYMSTEEILREYREAKNKKQQITILADQNLCTRSEIIKILIEAGEDMECMKPKKNEKEVVVPVAVLPDVILAALYEKMDLLDKEITTKEEEYKQIVSFIKKLQPAAGVRKESQWQRKRRELS